MKKRNPIAVILLTIVTLGIYGIYWQVKTKLEMNRVFDAKIPTAWLIIVPLVNIWWIWKYSEGVDKATQGKLGAILAFVLLFLLGVFGMAIIQYEFNHGTEAPVAAAAPANDFTQPAPGFGAPIETTPVTPSAPTTPTSPGQAAVNTPQDPTNPTPTQQV